MMAWEVYPEDKKKMKSKIETLKKKLEKQASTEDILLIWQDHGNKLLVTIHHKMENRVFNWIISKEFGKMIERLDKNAKVKKLKLKRLEDYKP